MDFSYISVVGDAICGASGYVELDMSSGFLSSSNNVQADFLAGTSQCPWRVKVKRGQKIALKLYNLGSWQVHEDLGGSNIRHRLDNTCYELAIAKEKSEDKRVTVCTSAAEREVPIYTSETNVLALHLVDRNIVDAVGPFMLKYEG